MEIVRCKNGHSYDPSVTPECPECARLRAMGGGTIPLDDNETWAPDPADRMDDIGKTQPVHTFGNPDWEPARGGRATEPVRNPDWRLGDDSGPLDAKYARDPGFPTMPKDVIDSRKGQPVSPVVGWLVCIAGPEKGKDFKIHADNNYIGRASYMDIPIAGDDTISRENHAILAYDTREKLYYFAPGNGRGIVRLNGRAVLMMTELHAYDKIEIGRSILVFMPFCGEKFSWEELED